MSSNEDEGSNHHAAAVFAATLDANKVRQEMLEAALSSAVIANPAGSTTSSAFNGHLLLPEWAQAQQWSQSQQQPHPFQKTFDDEVRRVTEFVNDQQERLEIAAKALFVRAHDALLAAEKNIRPVQDSDAAILQLRDLKRSARAVVDDCLALQEFYTSARTILADVASKADGKLLRGRGRGRGGGGVDCCSSSIQSNKGRLSKAHLNSSLVCVVSDIYAAIRQAEETIVKYQSNNNNAGGGGGGGGGDSPLWVAPSSFKRSTTKYWVEDENLTKLMMICAFEAPLLVYGRKGPLTSTKKRDTSVSEGDKLWDTLATRVNSIYFDSDDMSLYKERIKRTEGAQLLRARWYGTSMPRGDAAIFLELKTHHEKWVSQKSIKERATVRERDMVEFLEPVRWEKEDAQRMILRCKWKLKDDAEELAKQTGLLLRMHNLVVNHKLSGCVRTVYDRAAFQSSKSNGKFERLAAWSGVSNVTTLKRRRNSNSRARVCLVAFHPFYRPAPHSGSERDGRQRTSEAAKE